MAKLTHVKWIGPNEPVISILRQKNLKLYLTKNELLDLRDEISDFIAFYPDDFSEGRINLTTPSIEDFEVTFDKFEK